MKRIYICLVSLCVGALGALADTAPVYTAEQCVEMALANSKTALNADYAIEQAVSMRREAFTKYFPEVSAMGFAVWANHNMLQYNLLNLIELGIIKNGKTAGIQAMQPVFVGGQIYNGNKLAELGEEVARLRKEQTDNELRQAVTAFYWKLASLKATKGTLESAIATLDTIEAQVSVAVNAGLAMNNDLLKVQLKRNTYRSQSVDLDNGIALVKMLLGQYMGLGVDGDLDIAATVPAEAPAVPYDLFVPANDAVQSTADYRLLGKNIEAKRLERKIELGKNLPMVAVGAGWYYHDLLEQNHNFGAVQIGVNIPLTAWWGGSHALKRKKLAVTIAENERDDLTQKLQIQIQDKWNNLTAAHRKMGIEAEGIAQCEENYRLCSMYYKAGVGALADMLEAETSLQQARERYIAAYAEFSTARAAYLIATGR